MTNLQEAMKAVDAINSPQAITREEYMFAVALNAHRTAIAPRVLMTGHDIRQIRVIASMLNDAPQASVEAQRFEVVGDDRVVSSKTLDHMAKAVDELSQQEEPHS